MKVKFRAWDIVGCKGWVYGDLTHNQKVTKTGLEPRTMVGGYEVDPNSVCMFTGLKDRKGTDIYEGDILAIYYNDKKLFEAPVIWREGLAGFCIDEGDGCFSFIPKEYAEVIGQTYKSDGK